MALEPKRSLAEKIAIMQVAQAGGQIYVKAEQSDKYVKVDDPAWNWGVSDYQPVNSISTITSNAANTSLNYPSLVQKLNWLERGKKLENINTYATKVLNSAKTIINNNLDENLAVDMSGVDISTIGNTAFYNRLLMASNNDTNLVNQYLHDFTETIKPIIKDKLLTNVKSLLDESIQTKSSTLPNEESLYTNTAPTEQDIKNTVQTLADKIAFDYPSAPDKSIIEYNENNITAVFLKDIDNGNAITISYDLERTSLAEDKNIYQITDKIDDVEKKYTVVTIDELENKANEILKKVEELNANALSETASIIDDRIIEEHEVITTETNNLIDAAIEEYNSKNEAEIVSKAETTARNLFNNLSDNFAEIQAEAIANNIIDKVYPIGSIYVSSINANPADTLGIGTWTQIKDQFILAAGDIYKTANATGGEATHVLTIEEMPVHSHGVNDPGHGHSAYAYIDRGADDGNHTGTNFGSGDTNGTGDDLNQSVTVNASTTGITIADSGSGQAHNNMPPYIVKFVWERIA